MSKYRKRLPQIGDQIFLTDGGLETTLVFVQGIALPAFAAFDLLKDDAGIETLREYFDPYLEIAKRYKRGFILETPTWRANPDWATAAGYDQQGLTDANRKAVGLLLEMREGGAWRERIRGLRANASKRSHAELDESPDMDAGNPQELGGQYRELRGLLPNLTVLGGCCGTDHRHLGSIAEACC